MPQDGYSIGRDTTIVVTLASGTHLNLGKVISFTANQKTKEQEITDITGSTDNLRFFKGWQGTFGLERRGPSLDQYLLSWKRIITRGWKSHRSRCRKLSPNLTAAYLSIAMSV